jgi:hypothetical protein
MMMKHKEIVSRILDVLLFAGLFLLLLSFYLPYSHRIDFSTRSDVVDPFLKGTIYVPHPALHLLVYWISAITGVSYFVSMAFVAAVFTSVTVWLTRSVLLRTAQLPIDRVFHFLIALSLSVVIAIYIPGYSRFFYLGNWSPNIWHSPTMIMLEPFAILSFAAFVYYIGEREKTQPLVPLAICASTLLGVYIKPSFATCFLPAVGVYALVFRFRDYVFYRRLALVFLPPVLVLGYQFVRTYQCNDTASPYHDEVIFTWFGVFKVYTNNVLTSTLLVMAFPLSVTLFALRRALQNKYLLFAWLMTLIGFCEAAFVAEELKFEQAAFIFGYVICLHILFIAAMIEYLGWFRKDAPQEVKACRSPVAVVFSLHLVSGVWYLVELVKGTISL